MGLDEGARARGAYGAVSRDERAAASSRARVDLAAQAE